MSVVVVGAGCAGLHAATAAAAALKGDVVLVNGEDRLPYKRTHVSKRIAEGYTHEAFALQDQEWYGSGGIRLLSANVVAVNSARREMHLSTGESLRWDALVLATGARPRQFFGDAGTLTIRSARDGETVRDAVKSGGRAAVVGGGVLGVETASQLYSMGVPSRIYCRNAAPMLRDLGPTLAKWLADFIRERGVECKTGCEVESVKRVGEVLEVRSACETATFSAVIECVGTDADLRVAHLADLRCERGIMVNDLLMTSCEGVFAAGDCIQLVDGVVPHLWHQAEDQGKLAGCNAAAWCTGGEIVPYDYRPRRLKCEAFGTYLFSMSPERRDLLDELVTFDRDGVYCEFGFEQQQLSMVVMRGDKENAKAYELAVAERMPRAEAMERFASL